MNYRKKYKFSGLIIMTILLALSQAHSLTAKEEPRFLAGISNHGYVQDHLTLLASDGPVYYRNFNEKDWNPVQEHQSFMHGDSLRTGNNGYAVLAWSADNLILLKPGSSVRFTIHPDKLPQMCIQIFKARLMVSAYDSGLIEIEGRHSNLVVNHGETSIHSNEKHEIIRALKGQASCRLSGASTPEIIPESYSLKIDSEGKKYPQQMFNTQSEYESFRRFSSWLNKFNRLHKTTSLEIPFKINSVKLNNKFLANIPTNKDGFYVLDSGEDQILKKVHLKFKISPYPSVKHRFELYLSKNLVYPVREGSDGFHEVVFPVPSIPEFLLAIQMVDSQQRRVRIFKAGFSVHNRRSKKQIARQFCKDLTRAMSRRDHIWLRNHVSRDYRDWQGNSYYDFVKMSEDILRNYTDIRFALHPFRYEFRDNRILVHLNYRLSALTRDWSIRYEDRGSEIFTLIYENDSWRLLSKVSGMMFSRLKVAVDLRMGVLKGRVTDERTNRPLRRVRVTIPGTKYNTETDSMGEYIFYNIPPGEYDLKFFKNGYGELTATKVDVGPAGEQF
ncbi:MAG: carboxypeptidase regulatory-like domain-containing protein [Candidatus Rifleibacteriota bacterium]